ncbi:MULTISPECIES: hypothetical protein [Stenotrophomonas]|uniref:hypothetical protein n=2 Tax=Lysobacteraceae TaxID=32033 RepID=UPI00138FE2F1|nr:MULTISPECIES: hypothetical protein [unclassified Stenotrophomonas]MBH1393354.1 hypothetical protein [Stenotrophomonas maltophilia]MCU1058812.1 hypothetical protein [Stenotrophomonas maltophilia]MDH1243417.1 hypothetical protein [Stenotrophomonas sp. GD03948]MDH1578412.1 hypothetical protein [Stenotrophomonas sp. GD03744]
MQATDGERSDSITITAAVIQWMIATGVDNVQVRSRIDAIVASSHARLLSGQVALSRAWLDSTGNVAIATLKRAPHVCNVFEFSNLSHWHTWHGMQIM